MATLETVMVVGVGTPYISLVTTRASTASDVKPSRAHFQCCESAVPRWRPWRLRPSFDDPPQHDRQRGRHGDLP